MNNPRRKALNKIKEQIEDLKYQLEELLEEEQEYLDNIPENLQSSERYEKAEESVSALEDAFSSLEGCIDNIDTAIEQKGDKKMRLVHYFIYNTKTLKKVATFGTNRAKAEEELAKLNNTECYALGYKWFNL